MIRMRSRVRLWPGVSSACCTDGRATPSSAAVSIFVFPDFSRNSFAKLASSASVTFCFLDIGESCKKVFFLPTLFLAFAPRSGMK